MPTMFQQVFTALGNRNLNPNQRHLPMINSVTSSVQGFIYEINQINRKKKLMQWYKGIPELTAFANKVARDVTSKYHFEPVNKIESGRNKILKANQFALQSQVRDIRFSQMVDMIVTGDAYGWKGKLDKETIKQAIKKAYDSRLPEHLRTELKSVESAYINSLYRDMIQAEKKATEDIVSVSGVDEALLVPRKYRYVPSTTVENIHDQYDFIGYKHQIGMNYVNFSPEELIHYTLMNVDGKPNGFTSVESIIVQLELLRFMWQNMLSIEMNGGVPDKIIIAKDLQSNSESFKRMEEMLMKYKLVENKHGNMLFTGDIDVKDIRSIEDMQFKDLGLYITGLLAMQWGISKEAIPFIVGGTNTSVDGGGSAEDAYFEVVEWMQKTFSEDENSQLWIPYFGVRLVPDNPNLQRQVRLETARMNKFNNMITMDTILIKAGKQLTETKRLSMLDIDEADIEEWKPDPQQEMQLQQEKEAQAAKGMGTSAQQSPNQPSKDSESHAAKKRMEQAQVAANRGQKPSGTGAKTSWSDKFEIKDLDTDAEIQYKEYIGIESLAVNLETFIKLYNEDKSHDDGNMLRVFMRRNDQNTSFMYKSTDFVYKTIIKNEDLDSGTVNLMNFSGKIYKL